MAGMMQGETDLELGDGEGTGSPGLSVKKKIATMQTLDRGTEDSLLMDSNPGSVDRTPASGREQLILEAECY